MYLILLPNLYLAKTSLLLSYNLFMMKQDASQSILFFKSYIIRNDKWAFFIFLDRKHLLMTKSNDQTDYLKDVW